jgi:predicted CxxxxCH...CXXCH cytochrome family protein
MISKTHSFRDPRNPIGVLILLAAFAVATGCSTANTTSGGGDVVVNHVNASGNSVPGWITPTGGSHANSATMNYIANGGSSSCTECHGSDLAGGISRVSCFGNTAGCHHAPIPNWITAAVHGATAKNAPGSSGFASCQICHGNDFSGGGAKVSCYTCHGVSAPHAPKPWLGLSGSPDTHTDTVEAGNAPVCYQCHAYTGTANPNNPHVPPTPAPGETAPGCFNGTMCHNQASHAVPFNTTAHYSVKSVTFPGSCSPCHDVSAPSTKVGPVCQTCHIAGSPLTALSCTSCHANPPSGATTAYPNVAGAHAAHIALVNTGTPILCDTCHSGLGTNTLNHYNRANALPGKNALRVPPGDEAFLSTYNAKTGALSFDNSSSLNCSNVSCHGGQATPNWQTGTLDVNNQCTDCHVSGTSQYNSYNSGEHTRHLNDFGTSSTTCNYCHNTATLAVNHFTTLSTPAMEGPASATIGGAGTLVNTWNPVTKSCTPSCHANETW